MFFFFASLFHWILSVCFQGQTLYWPHIRNGRSDWHETKGKCISLILGVLCYLAFWSHPWPWSLIVQCQIRNSCISGMVGPINTGPTIWPWPLTTPMNYPWSFKVNVVKSLISGLIHMERKGCGSSIHGHDIDLCGVIIGWVGCVGVGILHSGRGDWGDFRHQCSIVISISDEYWYSLCIHVLISGKFYGFN